MILLLANFSHLRNIFQVTHVLSLICWLQPEIKWANSCTKLFFCSHFVPAKYFLVSGKQMHWATWVFFLFFFLAFLVVSFSFISEHCSRALNSWVFPVKEKCAEHGNLEFFRWTKNSRFLCEAHLSEPEKIKISGRSTFEWTEKTQDFRAKHI